jgi:hypothetical protein
MCSCFPRLGHLLDVQPRLLTFFRLQLPDLLLHVQRRRRLGETDIERALADAGIGTVSVQTGASINVGSVSMLND